MTTQPGQQPAPGAAPTGDVAPAAAPAGGAPAGGNAEHPAGQPPAGQPAGGQPSGDAKPWWEGKITEPEIVDYMKAKNYQTPEEAARAAWSANKMLKMEPAVRAFIEGTATAEQETAVLNRLRPESPDKYELKAPEGVAVDDALLALGRNIFHTIGATPKKAQEAFDLWNKGVMEMNAAQLAAEQQANEQELAALDTKYGPDVAKNKAAGLRVMESLGLDAEIMDKIQSKIGAAPLVDLLVRIGLKSGEQPLKDGAGSSGGGAGADANIDAMSKEQAQQRIQELTADATFQAVLTDKNNPARPAALAKWEKLHAKAT
jgi:hypothetical protein